MKEGIVILACIVLAAVPVSYCEAAFGAKQPWLGVHILTTSQDKVEQLTEAVGGLAKMGVNCLVAEINYGYEYRSHPELRAGNASSTEQIKKL